MRNLVGVDVVTARWPAEQARVEELRARGVPRLLLVEERDAPPAVADCLEDWVLLPARQTEIDARLAALGRRAEWHGARPSVDDDGILRHRDRWVSLSPVERRLAAALVDRFGAVVGREELAERAWPHGVPTRNALDVHVLRLRRRIAAVGLEVRTVRARGYLMQESVAPAGPVSPRSRSRGRPARV